MKMRAFIVKNNLINGLKNGAEFDQRFKPHNMLYHYKNNQLHGYQILTAIIQTHYIEHEINQYRYGKKHGKHTCYTNYRITHQCESYNDELHGIQIDYDLQYKTQWVHGKRVYGKNLNYLYTAAGLWSVWLIIKAVKSYFN